MMARKRAPYRWCVTCEEPVTLAPRHGAYHTATGRPEGADGHPVAVTDEDPGLRRQGNAIEAEYLVRVSARFRHLRADQLGVPDPRHWEADDADGLRRQLPASLRRPVPSGQGARS